jgi:glycosyltransferase, family 1
VSKTRNVSLLILGNGIEKEHLLDLVEELQISDIVHFEGFVSNPISYISKCDIYLQTSEIESFGNGVVEAQYCNIPAIVTDCGGPVELIENGKYGVNIGSFNSEEVISNGVQAVLNILDKKIMFHGLQERTRKYDALNLEKQFMEPYYECTKKN